MFNKYNKINNYILNVFFELFYFKIKKKYML